MIRKLGLAAIALVAMSTTSQAAPIVGTGSFGVLGPTADTALIGLGTTFSFGFVGWGGGTGDLAAVAPLMTPIVASTITATVGTLSSWTAPFGSFIGSVTTATASGPTNNRIVDLFLQGTFTPAGSLASFDPGPMNMTWSATQTGGPGSAVSVSWTIASAATPVPQPGSLALLGLGLGALGFASRRRAG